MIEPIDAPHGHDHQVTCFSETFILKQVAGVLGTSPGNNYGPPLGPLLDEEPIPFAEPDNSYNGPPLPPPYSTIGLPPFVEDHPPSYAMVEAIPDPRPSYGSPHGGVVEEYKPPSYQDSYGSPHGGIKRDLEDFFQISRCNHFNILSSPIPIFPFFSGRTWEALLLIGSLTTEKLGHGETNP